MFKKICLMGWWWIPVVDVHYEYDVQCRRPEVSGSCLRKIEYDVY